MVSFEEHSYKFNFYLLFSHAFGVISKNLLHNSRLQRFTSVSLLRVYGVIFLFLIHFELIFVFCVR